MNKKEIIVILATVLLLLLIIFVLPNLVKKEPIRCENEDCLYANFINCTPATLSVEPYDKIGVSTIIITGFDWGKCKYWIVSTPHASDVPQIKKSYVLIDSLNQETFNKIIEEAKNM